MLAAVGWLEGDCSRGPRIISRRSVVQIASHATTAFQQFCLTQSFQSIQLPQTIQ